MEGKSPEFQEVSSVSEERFNSTHHLITLAAFRYALGRRSYIVSEVIEWIEKYWDEIAVQTKKIIIEEVEQAVMLSCAGDECDQKSWEMFLEFAHKKSRFI